MTVENKRKRYLELVNKVKNCQKLDDCNKNGGIMLKKCDFCDEINLWSYWEGGAEHLDADILLVGQDWGRFTEEDRIKFNMQNLKYMDKNKSLTDKNLCELFDEIGINGLKNDCNNKTRLFFTNFVLCYRDGKNTGGFKKRWSKNCTEYFCQLAEIIEPKVILCLGRNVFESVLLAYNYNCSFKKSYNKIIDDGPIEIVINGNKTAVFPLAHCGNLGTYNRNKPSNEQILKGKELFIQKNDWNKIKEYI